MRVSYQKLCEYIVAHPNVRTLLVEPQTFLELLQLIVPKNHLSDESGEFIRLHWTVIRPDVGFEKADESALRERVA